MARGKRTGKKPVVIINNGPRKGSKRSKRKGKGKNRGGSGISGLMALVPKVCAAINPFCPEARGAKWHDITSANTTTYQTRYIIQVPLTAGSGQAALTVRPTMNSAYNTGATFAANVVTSWSASTADPAYSTAGNLFTDYRVVNWGAKWTTTASNNVATGNMIVGESTYNVSAINTFSLTDLNSTNNAMMYSIRDGEFAYIGKPIDDRARECISVSSTGTTGWSELILFFNGGPPSTDAGYLEVIVNYEGHPVQNSAYLNFATASPMPTAHTNMIEDASTIVRDKLAGTFDTGGKGKEAIEMVVETAAIGAIGMLAAPLLPEAAAVAGVANLARLANGGRRAQRLALTM